MAGQEEMREGSPHGFVNRRDLSDAGRSASGDPLSPRRIEKCVCGGEIEAPNNWPAIADAVDLHNSSMLHQQWRAWQGLPQ